MVKIITDSAADLEPWEYEKMDVDCIPLTVYIGETAYKENVNLTKNRFYALLADGGYPKTAQASPQIVVDLFQAAAAAGQEAVYITISSALSGTYQSAVAAQQLVQCDGCHVVDGLNATGGQRMLVEYAVKLRDQGHTASQIVEKVSALRSRIVLLACMDTLEYLYHGGRISHTVYKLGSLAQVKPIIRVFKGRVEVPAKAMGMRKGMDYLCRRLEQQIPDPAFPLYVMYTGDRTKGQILRDRLAELGHTVPDERIINVGAAIGSHIGPGACGLVYVETES